MRDWLRLIRASGLATIVSNTGAAVLATAFAAADGTDPRWLGILLVHHWPRAVWVLAAGLLLYAAGMLWNDLADVEQDRISRPKRPLPSGRIALPSAWVAAVLASIGALWCAAQVPYGLNLAGTVLSLILLYDLVAKGVPWLGSLVLAAVRAGHALFALLILGPDWLRLVFDGAATPGGWLLAYPTIIGVYVFGVALLAELEDRPARRWEVLVAGACMAIGLGLALARLGAAPWIGIMQRSGGGWPVLMLAGVGASLLSALWLAWSLWRPWSDALRTGKRQLVGFAVLAGLGGIILLDLVVACAAFPLLGLALLPLLLVYHLLARLARMD